MLTSEMEMNRGGGLVGWMHWLGFEGCESGWPAANLETGNQPHRFRGE